MNRLVFRIEHPETGLGPFTYLHKEIKAMSIPDTDFPIANSRWCFGMTSLKHLRWWHRCCDPGILNEECYLSIYRVKRGGLRVSPRMGKSRSIDPEFKYASWHIAGRECLFRKDKATLLHTIEDVSKYTIPE